MFWKHWAIENSSTYRSNESPDMCKLACYEMMSSNCVFDLSETWTPNSVINFDIQNDINPELQMTNDKIENGPCKKVMSMLRKMEI